MHISYACNAQAMNPPVHEKNCRALFPCFSSPLFQTFGGSLTFGTHMSFAAFTMTKRDSEIAELPSPRVLRMESQDVEMPMATVNSYTSSTQTSPVPLPNTNSSSSHEFPGSLQDSHRSRQLPTTLQPGEYRQRIGHTTIFKIFEQADQKYLQVEKIDSEGYSKKKTMEHYFFGIIGHIRDAQGQPLDSWEMCQKLANYWRTWFGLPTHPLAHMTFQIHRHLSQQLLLSQSLRNRRSQHRSSSWHGSS